MIDDPFDDNDTICLATISELVADLVARRDPRLVELAAQHPTAESLATWIRTLPQRDDDGVPGDGPKVRACEPVQRIRVGAPDPNCFERSALYLGAAELIDPDAVRRLATFDFPEGRHTVPIENEQLVVLDPGSAPGGSDESTYDVAQAVANDPPIHATDTTVLPESSASLGPAGLVGPVVVDVNDALAYTAQLGDSAARTVRNGVGTSWLARNAIRRLVDDGIAPKDPGTVDAMGWFFAQAEDTARAYGARALAIVRTTAQAIAELIDDVLAREQRNLSFDIAGTKIDVPSWLTDAGSFVGRAGLDLGALALKSQLGDLGITGAMVGLVEQELNTDGLTLGPLAHEGQSFSRAFSALRQTTS